MEHARKFWRGVDSRIRTYRLKKIVGDVVSLLVSNDPFPSYDIDKIGYLIIKRPSDDKWKPNYFSLVTEHIEEGDIKNLRMYPYPWDEEGLYLEAGSRGLREEIIRSPSAFNLRYLGKYHDNETNYNVAVLTGDIYGAGTTTEKVVIPKTKGTEESPEIFWMPVKQIKQLVKEGKFAGEKSFEMVIRDLKRFQ